MGVTLINLRVLICIGLRSSTLKKLCLKPLPRYHLFIFHFLVILTLTFLDLVSLGRSIIHFFLVINLNSSILKYLKFAKKMNNMSRRACFKVFLCNVVRLPFHIIVKVSYIKKWHFCFYPKFSSVALRVYTNRLN